MTASFPRLFIIRRIARLDSRAYYIAYPFVAIAIFGLSPYQIGLSLLTGFFLAYMVGGIVIKCRQHENNWEDAPLAGLFYFVFAMLAGLVGHFAAEALHADHTQAQRIFNVLCGTVLLFIAHHNLAGNISVAYGAAQFRADYAKRILEAYGITITLRDAKHKTKELEYLADPNIPVLAQENGIFFKAATDGRWAHLTAGTIKCGEGQAYRTLTGYECEKLGQLLSARERMTYVGV